MVCSIAPKRYFNFLRFVGVFTGIWPLNIHANRTARIIHEIKWWIAFCSATGLLIPLLLGVYYFRNDSITMMKSLSELTALSEVFINLIQFKIYKKNFQVI